MWILNFCITWAFLQALSSALQPLGAEGVDGEDVFLWIITGASMLLVVLGCFLVFVGICVAVGNVWKRLGNDGDRSESVDEESDSVMLEGEEEK